MTPKEAERLRMIREAGVEWNSGEQAGIQEEVSGVRKIGNNTGKCWEGRALIHLF